MEVLLVLWHIELPRKKQEERFCKKIVASGSADRNTFEFLKIILFSRVREGGVFAAGIGAFHGVFISLKMQNLPIAEFQQLYRHVLI